MMTKTKAILKVVKDIYKEAKKAKKPQFIGQYCKCDNFNVVTDSFRILATTADLNKEATENPMINYLNGVVTGAKHLKNKTYLPNVDELRNAIETINTEGKQKEIAIVFDDKVTLNAYWLLNALEAIEAYELNYLDCKHQIMIEDNTSRFIMMPIVSVSINSKTHRKEYRNTIPADKQFICVNDKGELNIIDRRPAPEEETA